jgi:class 3 adenylate cyclase/tetratricopeptide (TPR) repeat protein
MITCPVCGQRNPDRFRFCGACGRALATQEAAARAERKVVSVLFVDLVGYTARAELMDPEDVARWLVPYRARIREELERFGGTVEKFIGDGAMAIFGAPVTHEDDAERAVRAALAIREAAQAQDVDVRIGINTGEALVTFRADSAEGEATATGDVVNTAARLEAAAPVNGIVAGDATYQATRHVIEYREVEAVRAKGKRKPVIAWEAVGIRSAPGAGRPHATPLVGRGEELRQLAEALDQVRESRAPRVVTLLGAPGIGKSRLVHEFRAGADDVTWLQGRCMAYGSGMAFGALGEIVKQQAGIRDADSTARASAKLRQAVADALGDDEDAAWVEEHLRPLIGLGRGGGARHDRQAEAFFAWRRFLEGVASHRPLVLVLEDLHWADDDLLDFVDHVLEWVTGVPLILLCTARPELVDRRPGWGAEGGRSALLRVPALGDDEVARLVTALLGPAALSADLEAALIERAGGNPLYAEQYTRLLLERGLVDGSPPPTLQGLIAARLDALPAADKELLQAAAVIGRAFWTGGVAAICSADRWSTNERLRALERKELIRLASSSSIADETEWTFGHVLIRDVAYAQVRRSERAEMHTAAAEWVESLGRPDEHAELVAHHYVTALELAPAAPIAERARLALRAAGDRAFAVNAFAAAVRHYEKALELWPDDEPERAQLQLNCGRALYRVSGSGAEAFAAARDGLLAAGDDAEAAEAEIMLAWLALVARDHDGASTHLERALELIAAEPPSWVKAFVLSHAARAKLLRAEMDGATELAAEALEIAEALGLEEIQSHALNTLGSARTGLGDPAGLEDVERSVAIARSSNSPEVVSGYHNLAVATVIAGDLERSFTNHMEALRGAERMGLGGSQRFLRAHQVQYCYWSGSWDEAVARADAFLAEAAESPHLEENQNLDARALIRLARADLEGALSDSERSAARLREGDDPPNALPSLAVRAFVLLAAGDREAARALAQSVLERWAGSEDIVLAWGGAGAVAAFATLEDPEALGVPELQRATLRPWLAAALAYLEGDFEAAAAIYARIGSRPDEAFARLRAAERFAAEGEQARAERHRAQALAFYRAVGAARYVAEAERVLVVPA